ncbi:kyphoscoliosis peptidase-like isoform X2 [Glandiceps talaboti]
MFFHSCLTVNAAKDLKNSPTELVNYLTSIADNDLEKFRVLFRWEAENVEYDVDSVYGNKGRGDNSPEGVLKNRMAVCEGYSGLFKWLCSLAGLETKCVSLSGVSKGADYQPGDPFELINGKIKTTHAWNKICVNGQWYLCDCTWAAGTVDFDENLGKRKYSRHWEESYFLSKPEMFASKHFPVDENGNSAPGEQLLKNPISDLNVWSDQPAREGAFFAFSMEAISHNQGLIEADENEVTIKLKSPFALQFWRKLQVLNPKGTTPRKGTNVSTHVMTYKTDDVINFRVRLPSQGDFVLDIGAKSLNITEELKSMREWAISYTIKGKGSTPKPAFPPGVSYDVWGTNAEFSSKGFQVIGLEEPIIRTNTGNAQVAVKLPNTQAPLLADLVHVSEGQADELPGRVCGEKNGQDVLYSIVLPYTGEYRFTIHAKLRPEENNDTYWQGANILIENSKPADVDEKFPERRGLWGPDEKFYELGLQEMGSPTRIIAEDGSCELKLAKHPDIQVIFDLEKNGRKYGDGAMYVFADTATDGSEVTFRARLPERGYYNLTLYAKNRNKEGSYPNVGFWLLESRSSWNGELYPLTANGSWGPAKHFLDLGLQVVDHKSSLIGAANGRCLLTIKAPEPITTTPYLEKNGARLPEDEKKNCINITSDDVSISYSLTLPESGFYKIELYGDLKGSSTLPYLGCWLINSLK